MQSKLNGKPFSIQLLESEFGGVAIELGAEHIKSDHDLIAKDPFRQTTDNGNDLYWINVKGAMLANASLKGSLPAGGGMLSWGFSANSVVSLSILRPFVADLESATRQARDLVTDIPYSAENVLELPMGSEVVLRGYGKIAGNVGYGVAGAIDAVPGVSAMAGVTAAGSADMELTVRIKRLDEDRVMFSINRGFSYSGSVSVGLKLELDAAALPTDAIAQISEQVAAKASEWVTEEPLLALSYTHSVSRSERKLVNYVIHAEMVDGAVAYEQLFRLNTDFANELADADNAAIARATLDERVTTRNQLLQASFAHWEVLKAYSQSTAQNLTITNQDRTYHIDAGTLASGYSPGVLKFLFAKHDIERQLVAIDENGALDRYYRVHQTFSDPFYGEREVQRFLVLADLLGLLQEEHRELIWDEDFLTSFKASSVTREVDVYVRAEGLQDLYQVAQQEFDDSYSDVFERLDRTEYNDISPWLLTAHPKHQEVTNILKLFLKAPPVKRKEYRKRYRKIHGQRQLRPDAIAYRDMRNLRALIKKIGSQNADPSQMIETFADASRQDGLDFWRELGTIGQLTIDEDVLVVKMEITSDNGESIDFSEGVKAPEQLDEKIKRWMALA